MAGEENAPRVGGEVESINKVESAGVTLSNDTPSCKQDSRQKPNFTYSLRGVLYASLFQGEGSSSAMSQWIRNAPWNRNVSIQCSSGVA